MLWPRRTICRNVIAIRAIIVLLLLLESSWLEVAHAGRWKKRKEAERVVHRKVNSSPSWAQDEGVRALCGGILADTPAFPLSKHSDPKSRMNPKRSRIDAALSGGKRLSHCAVVGSSAVARYCDWAAHIDEIPYIIRSNLQPAAMYPDVVGGRTEIQFRFSTSVRHDQGLGHCSFSYFDVHDNRTRRLNMCTGAGGAWAVSVHNRAFDKRPSMDKSVTAAHRRYVYTGRAENLAGKCARAYGPVGTDASSGIRSVLFALLICDRVEVFNLWGYDHVKLGGEDYPLEYSFYTETGHGKGPIRTDEKDGAWVGFHKFSDELRYIRRMAKTPGINMQVHLPSDEHCSAAIEKSRPKLKFSRP